MASQIPEAFLQSVSIDDLQVKFRDGSTVCSCGLEPWCDHAEKALRESADAIPPLLVKNAIDVAWTSVPLVPTRRVWCTVRLDNLEHTGAYSATLSDPAVRPKIGDIFLGVISGQEGRAVLRSMVLAWFRIHYDSIDHDVSCESTSHGYKQVKLEQINKTNPAFALANDWSKVWQGMCLNCVERLASIDDLVPDRDGPTWGGNRVQTRGVNAMTINFAAGYMQYGSPSSNYHMQISVVQ